MVAVNLTEAEIDRWVAKQGLPPRATQLFRIPKINDPFLLGVVIQGIGWYRIADGEQEKVISRFIEQKTYFIDPLREICSLLNTDESMAYFAYALQGAYLYWGPGGNEKGRSSTSRAKKIRRDIAKKTIDIVKLAKELDSIIDVHIGFAQSYSYPDLMRRAADIQTSYRQRMSYSGPPISPCPSLEEKTLYRYELDIKFQGFIDDASSCYDTFYPLPTMESLILAYGQKLSDELNYPQVGMIDPLKFSTRSKSKKGGYSPADFVRGFTSLLKKFVDVNFLPQAIQGLSFGSIEEITAILYLGSSSEISIDKYIDRDWKPIKDSTADKHDRAQKRSNKIKQ